MKKILVATDLSSRADRAILRAIKLATAHKAHLTIVCVVDEDTPTSLLQETKKIAEQEINFCIKNKIKNIKYDIRIVVGMPHHSILEIAVEENVDLIVLGLHRHIEENQPIIGKVIERVILNSMKPVLIVKNRAELDYKNTLVGVDFNIHSKKSLKLALSMFKDSNFHLIHSYYMPILGAFGNSAALEQEFKVSCSADIDSMVKEITKSLAGKSSSSKKSFNISTKITKGSISDILKEEALYLKSELLVLGTHGRTGLAKLLSLNVTESFLVNPPCDLLVVM